MRLLLELLEKSGTYNALEKAEEIDRLPATATVAYFASLKKMINNTPNKEFKLTDPMEEAMLDLVSDGIMNTQTDIVGAVDQAMKNMRYTPYDFKSSFKEIFSLYNDLKEFVPPCEKSPTIPANVVSILNAAMIFFIEGKENYFRFWKKKDIQGELEAENKINELILKGMELSYLERRLKT